VQILHRGRLHDVPEGFAMMAPARVRPVLSSSLLSTRGKLRLLMERFLPADPPPGGDESIGSFVTRRFGREVLERIAGPLLGSLLVADPDRLSLQATLPRFLEMERAHGSVTRAVRESVRGRAAAGRHAGAYSEAAYLRDGFERIVSEARARLPREAVVTGARVRGIRRAAGGGWELDVQGAPPVRAGAVILACPAYAIATLLRGVDPPLAAEIGRLEYASCATVNLVYRDRDLRRRPSSFGFFVPRAERSPLVAVSFVSEKCAGRVGTDRFLARAFLGGAHDPRIVERDEEALAGIAHEELRRRIGVRAAPLFSHAVRMLDALPQYEVGFPARLAGITRKLEESQGLLLAGSAAGAFGLPDCIASGERAAHAAIEHLKGLGRCGPIREPATLGGNA
jgi:oxygen-dependent protoporphyrinogen oxidase